MRTLTAEIFVLNYNGKELLSKCLPSIVEASQRSTIPCSVTVIDNCSSDGSVKWLRQNFPDIPVRVPERNLVLCSFNEAVRESPADIVLLLNNDLKVDRNFVAPLVDVFLRCPDAFFAAPKFVNYETGECEGARSKMEFRWGLLWGSARHNIENAAAAEPLLTMQCGMGAFRRDRFLEIGGYDDLYLPGTVEDSDLCFRGWRRGWKGYYCSSSIVHHMGQVSFKRAFGASGIRRINRRNLYLFVWKNIRSRALLTQHLLFLPLQLLKYLLFGQLDFVRGFIEAVRLLPRALQKRHQARHEPLNFTDRMVFAVSKGI